MPPGPPLDLSVGLVDVTRAVGLSVAPAPFVPATPYRSDAESSLIGSLGAGLAVADYDGDGDLDVFLLRSSDVGNSLFRNDLNDGVLRFTEVTAEAGLAGTPQARVATFADLDGDGLLDLLLGVDAASDEAGLVVLRNIDGTRFAAATHTGLVSPGFTRGGLTLADHDGDGLVDLYAPFWTWRVYNGASAFPGRNQMFRNLGGLRFEDVTDSSGLGTLDRDSWSAVWADFDGVPGPDLYVAVDHTEDEFYAHRDGGYVDAGESAGVRHRGHDMGIAAADLDDDDDLDLFVTNIFFAGSALYLGNTLLVAGGQGETFRFSDQARGRGVLDTAWGWGASFVDLDNDQNLDLAVATGFDGYVEHLGGFETSLYDSADVVFLGDEVGRFKPSPTYQLPPSDSRALVTFDADRDGDQDVVVSHPDGTLTLFLNTPPAPKRWLTVRLCHGRPACQPLGARVYAELPGRTLRRDLLSGTSFRSGFPLEVHVGLGDVDIVPRLRVAWPDGTETVMTGVAADQVLTLP